MNNLPVIQAGLTKKKLEEMAGLVASAMADGEISNEKVLLVAEQVAAISTFIELLKEDNRYRKAVLEELQKFPMQKGTLTSGAAIAYTEVGTKYLYQEDAVWSDLKEKMKAREEILKKIPPGMQMVDEETGEMISGVGKVSSPGWRITFRKG